MPTRASAPLPLLPLLLLLQRSAALSLPTHFASSMVVQRGAATVFWGRDAPGETVSVSAFGEPLAPATCDANGRWQTTIPALAANATPGAISVSTSSGAPAIFLTDVVVGDVFVISGQSNAAVPLSWMAQYSAVLARADALGARLRHLSVANLDAYADATQPQDNFSASIAWSRASSSAVTTGAMSALGYLFGAQVAEAQPDLPVGLIAAAWGGVAIEVFMSPAALAQCSAEPREPTPAERRALAVAAAGERALAAAATGVSIYPSKYSCLYNSMLHPIVSIPVTAFLW
jgi:sialate O-acetylesterase